MKKLLNNFYSIILLIMLEKTKRTRTCWKYHYDTIQICRETDRVYTKCRICGEWKPSNLQNFAKETHANKKRELQPLCRECLKEQQKGRNKKYREAQKPITVESHSLFEGKVKEELEKETMESKLDKVIAFLSKFWLK